MSPEKPKRPSARPSARRSVPPPDTAEKVPEIPRAPAVPEGAAAAPRIEKKKLRVSARRGPGGAQPAVEASPRSPAQTPASKRASAAQRPKPRASATVPATPKRVRAEAKPAAPEAPKQPLIEPPVAPAVPSTNGASTHVVAEPRPDDNRGDPDRFRGHPAATETDDIAEYADDDIWSEADTGPSVHLYVAPRPSSPDPVPESEEPAPVSRLARSRRDGERDEGMRLASVQNLASTDYYFRQYGAHGMRSLSAEVDDFGLDPHVEERAKPWLEGLCKRYFRVAVDGVSNLPPDGRVLMVCNRAGALPWDGLVLRTAVRMARPELGPVRWLAEDSVFHYPFLGVFMNRLGAVRACPENAERLLKQDKMVAVFPEGAHGSGKLFKDRYRLQRFGRGGYVKLALKLGAPIVPTAIIGSEETNPVLARSRFLGKMFGGEALPITPTFPWLGAAGLLPAPVKWRIVVGEPIDLSSYGPKSADEALLVHRLNEQIRGILQQLVEQALGARRSVLFG